VDVSKGFGQSQLDADHPTPGGITQYIPIDPQAAGPPPLEQYAPVIPVRVDSPTPLPSRAYTVFLTAPLTTGGAQQLLDW
jgi:hypothetical protein